MSRPIRQVAAPVRQQATLFGRNHQMAKLQQSLTAYCLLIELRFYVSLNTETLAISETFFPAHHLAWYYCNDTKLNKADIHQCI